MPKVRAKPMAITQSAAPLNNPYMKLLISIQYAPTFFVGSSLSYKFSLFVIPAKAGIQNV
jgi:hypothetical protein